MACQFQVFADRHLTEDSCLEDAAALVGNVARASPWEFMQDSLDFGDGFHGASEHIRDEKNVGQQRDSKDSGQELPSASTVANADASVGTKTESADDGDWLTVSLHNSKQEVSHNKRVTSSCLDERKPGGLSAAFKAKDSHDEHTFQLDEELESVGPLMPKGQPLSTKRLIHTS
jgi:hypothetical protein